MKGAKAVDALRSLLATQRQHSLSFLPLSALLTFLSFLLPGTSRPPNASKTWILPKIQLPQRRGTDREPFLKD
jgi:hypothetical protein